MKHLRKTETNNLSTSTVLVFAAIIFAVIGVTLVITACTKNSEHEMSAPYIYKISHIDKSTYDSVSATHDQIIVDSSSEYPTITSSVETISKEANAVADPTEASLSEEIAETEDVYKYGEQNYEITDEDYKLYDYSQDVDLLARIICLESGDCSDECQRLVGSTAMNLADIYGGLSEVAYDYTMFNVAYNLDYCQPSDKNYEIAESVVSGNRDYNVKAFKTGGYHEWATPYIYLPEDGVYFSTY